MATVATIDVISLNRSLQPLVQACFWSAIALAALLPIAATAGGFVAGKIEKAGKGGRYG